MHIFPTITHTKSCHPIRFLSASTEEYGTVPYKEYNGKIRPNRR